MREPLGVVEGLTEAGRGTSGFAPGGVGAGGGVVAVGVEAADAVFEPLHEPAWFDAGQVGKVDADADWARPEGDGGGADVAVDAGVEVEAGEGAGDADVAPIGEHSL
jgi:hypothetical protein